LAIFLFKANNRVKRPGRVELPGRVRRPGRRLGKVSWRSSGILRYLLYG